MLTKEQFGVWFEREVMGRWPKVHFTAVDIGDWFYRLGGYDNCRLTAAVCQYRVSCDPSRPNISKVYSQLLNSSDGIVRRKRPQLKWVYMHCLEDCWLKKGHKIKVMLGHEGADKGLPEEFATAYGGKWEIV